MPKLVKKPAHKKPAASSGRIMKKPAFIPKKGLQRLAKRPRGGPCLRRPSTIYTKTRTARGALCAGRRDRLVCHTNIKSFFTQVRETDIKNKLVKDGLLVPRLVCSSCGRRVNLHRMEYGRCSHADCRQRLHKWVDHPVFSFHSNALSWCDQATLLMMLLHDLPNHMIHCVGGFGHHTVEDMRHKLRTHIQEYVINKQATFKFGTDDGNWTEVEADEVTLAKRASGDNEYSEWCQYLGLMQRGAPETLVLEALPVRQTSRRAPGAGPLTKEMWRPIGMKYLAHRNIILHTDSAKAYGLELPGVTRTAVVHQVKKVRGRWLRPHYTRAETLTLPNGDEVDVLAGTQYVDGLWRRLRTSIGQSHSSNFDRIDILIRFMQWKTWNTGVDPWLAFASTIPRS